MEVNVKDKTDTGKYSQEELKYLRDLRESVHRDDEDRSTWKQKMIVAINQRLGVKRYTNFPYPGAPDIPLPETDKLIKKAVPAFALSAYSPKKKCTVHVQDGVAPNKDYETKARKTEAAMNMILSSKHLNWFKKLLLAADNFKQYGHAIFRIYEEYKCRIVNKVINLDEMDDDTLQQLKSMSTNDLKTFVAEQFNLDLEDETDLASIEEAVKQFKAGETIIDFDIEEVSCLPQVDVVLPTKIIVPAYTHDINVAERLCYEYFIPKSKLLDLMNKEIFIKKDLEQLKMAGAGETDNLEKQKGYNEGIIDNTSAKDLYRIHEICCWKQENKNEPARRKVYTFLADVLDPEEALLQDIAFPYEYEGWFYEKHDNEVKDSRYYSSRGLPEQTRALQEISERALKNLLVRDEMNNTPIWEVLSSSEIMDGHIHMTPGAKVPVSAIGTEIRQLNQGSKVDASSERIMQMLKAYSEEYVGSTDQLFRNATNQGGGKTAREVQMGIQQASGPINVEVISWNDTLSRVYTKMFKLMGERLGESIYIKDIEVTREDFNFPADVRSNGDLEVSDQELAAQKSSQRVNVLLNPGLADMVAPDDRYNIVRDWLEKDGVKDPDQFITNPQEMMQNQMMQMKQQMQQMQQQLSMGQEELEKNQKDAYKAKRLEKKHINQAEAATEGGKQAIGEQVQAAEEITGRTIDELLGQQSSPLIGR